MVGTNEKSEPNSGFRLHNQSGETVGNWVGNQLPAGWDTHLDWATSSFRQLSTQKVRSRWATSTTISGLANGHVFGSPSKATDACVPCFKDENNPNKQTNKQIKTNKI